jgi:Ni,Fe-hydrogenase I small subunit
MAAYGKAAETALERVVREEKGKYIVVVEGAIPTADGGVYCTIGGRTTDAGVTDNVEVVQAQESLTSAELDVINSVFAHNVAKLSLARSIASAADGLQEFLSLQ